jgi:hypothetical protein
MTLDWFRAQPDGPAAARFDEGVNCPTGRLQGGIRGAGLAVLLPYEGKPHSAHPDVFMWWRAARAGAIGCLLSIGPSGHIAYRSARTSSCHKKGRFTPSLFRSWGPTPNSRNNYEITGFSLAITKPGTYEYACPIHPKMVATVVVSA